MRRAKLTEFQPLSGFELGYRNREDITTLSPKVMVVGSRNILTSTRGTIGNRRGYTLDGPANKDGHPIVSSYDWFTHIGTERNLRYTNNKLQYRYQTSAGIVSWRDLITLTGSTVNFTEFWDAVELKSLLLFVDGSSNIYSWTGGIGLISATTVNTITLSTGTWASTGFISTGTNTVTINGHVYTYTGGVATATLTGVTPDPTGEANGSIAHANVVTTANSAMTAIPAAFKNTLIATYKQHVYVAASDSPEVYVSKVNTFKDYTFTKPTRVVDEGMLFTLDAVPTAIVIQDSDVYISAGRNFWYRIVFKTADNLLSESFAADRLKTGPLQASQSQGLTCKIKNKVAFVSFEPIVNFLGIDQNILNVPQLDDISYPIVNDMNVYNFTGGHSVYFRKNLCISAPVNSTVIVYNMTQDDVYNDGSPKHYWECPQTLPVGRFSIINGELYGHSSTDGETFKLFSGWNDAGKSYAAEARFAYDAHGSRNLEKSGDELFIEGYIQTNSTVHSSLRREYGGSIAELPDILGTNTQIVGQIPDDASLGKVKLGNVPLGGSTATLDGQPDIPKFRVYLTFPRTPFFEEQVSFKTDGIDQRFEIVDFGSNASVTTELPTNKKI